MDPAQWDPALLGVIGTFIVALAGYLYNEWQIRPREKCPVCGRRNETTELLDGTKSIGKKYLRCQHKVRDDGTVVP